MLTVRSVEESQRNRAYCQQTLWFEQFVNRVIWIIGQWPSGVLRRDDCIWIDRLTFDWTNLPLCSACPGDSILGQRPVPWIVCGPNVCDVSVRVRRHQFTRVYCRDVTPVVDPIAYADWMLDFSDHIVRPLSAYLAYRKACRRTVWHVLCPPSVAYARRKPRAARRRKV